MRYIHVVTIQFKTKMNPASRLLAISQAAAKLRPKNNNTKAMEMWPQALSAINIHGEMTERELTRYLDALITQVEITEQLLEDIGVPADLFEARLTTLKSSFSPTKLGHGWPHISPGFRPEVLTTLEWASWTLKDKEVPIDSDEIQELSDQLQELQDILKSDGIPKGLKIMVRRQLAEIQEALSGYAITGVNPLKDALNRAAGEFSIEREAIKRAASEASDEQKTNLDKFRKFAIKGADAVERAARFAGAIDKLHSYGTSIASALKIGS